jgi:hypothetical protein
MHPGGKQKRLSIARIIILIRYDMARIAKNPQDIYIKPDPEPSPGKRNPLKHLAAGMLAQTIDDLQRGDIFKQIDALDFLLDDGPAGIGFWLEFAETPHRPDAIFQDVIEGIRRRRNG